MANRFGFGGGSQTTTQGGNRFGFGGGGVTPSAPMSTGSGFNSMYESVGDTLYDQDLIEDKNFVEASKII